MKKAQYGLLSLTVIGLTLFQTSPASATDKTVNCLDNSVGKACLECHQGGSQVCCAEHGTCTVNKISLTGTGGTTTKVPVTKVNTTNTSKTQQ